VLCTSSAEPRPDTAENVHEVVLELLKDEKPGKTLDVGAGEGALTNSLMQRGFDVEPCDFNPERFKITTKKCRKVDLNQPLPYPNESFDFVVCIEVIEHLHNPWFVVSESRRVLKRNGKLVITTPNVLSIISRIVYLIYGEYAHFNSKQLCEQTMDLYHKLDRHINPIWFPELECILRENNMSLQKIATNRYICGGLSSPSRLAALIALSFIKGKMLSHFGENSRLSSAELLYGDILILKAKKVG
jgi:2-polyprenyl-3-methyl-5-hydroxy-6-metoxy-1,4-benzoquinol methylase